MDRGEPEAHTDVDSAEKGPAGPPATEASGDPIYQPVPGEIQLTARAVLVGCLLGGLVSAMNIYFGLRTGWSIGGSLIAAILGYAVLALIPLRRPSSVLETNIIQTTGSAAGTMTSAAGLLAAIPAMRMLGYELGYLELTLWAISVAYLGVFFAVPLRRQMVVEEKLRFPTGTATAETILAMFSTQGSETVEKARSLICWGIAAAVFSLAAFFLPQLGHPPMEWIALGAIGAWGFSLLLSPMMTGAGILIGPRVGASLLAGALVGWAVLGPIAQYCGWAGAEVMEYAGGVRGWLLWPGVAIMVADALASLALSWRTILRTFKRTSPRSASKKNADAIPNTWWVGGLVAASTLTVVAAWAVFDISPVLTVVAILLSWVLAMIAVRSTGETDINPVGGMGKVTQLVFGGLAPGRMGTNLMAAAITGAGASQAADMMQDLKTGHLLRASPRRQLIAQIIGIPAGVLFCIPIYMLFDRVYEIGGKEIPAPAAHAWRAMAELLAKGFEALPPMADKAVIAGLAFGVLTALLRRHKRIGKFMPSGLAFGIAFIIQAYFSIAMFIGSMILVVWQRRAAAHAERFAFPVASGLIAGEGLMGVVTAILTLFGLGALT